MNSEHLHSDDDIAVVEVAPGVRDQTTVAELGAKTRKLAKDVALFFRRVCEVLHESAGGLVENSDEPAKFVARTWIRFDVEVSARSGRSDQRFDRDRGQ